MEIILAGYNIDRDVIDEFHKQQPERHDLTPETVAAAYARISRNPAPVNALRKAARGEVEKARLSNKNIVFEMGHSSIAEHAVFNIDVIGVSRLLVEEIERSRLASYTEKSQRYVLLSDDFVIPDEIRGTNLEDAFVAVVRRQNAFYHELYAQLRPYVFDKNRELASDTGNTPLLEGWAKEDARYCLSLATEAQLGMTINARNAELMIRRLGASELAEARTFSRKLFEAVSGIAPSLVRYTSPTPYDTHRREALRQEVAVLIEQSASLPEATPGASEGILERHVHEEKISQDGLVRLVAFDADADDRIAAALLSGASNLSFAECTGLVKGMSSSQRASLFKTALMDMRAHDAAPREFEHAFLTFELVLSASCYAQMKRHRMATLSAQGYDPALGMTVPASVVETGMENAFREMGKEAEDLYWRIREVAPAASASVLTNAHRRRVLVTMNVRELYHLARVRADRHAQWDIRHTSEAMTGLAREVAPLSLLFACGKDAFEKLYSDTVGNKS